jgi:hypothetical protein
VVATDCDNDPARAPNDVTTTSAAIPHPAAAPSSVHTVDSTGFVDNGGRTSDEVARTEMSGMTPTEQGSERVTGTPGSGLHLPPYRAAQRERPAEGERVAEAGVPRAIVASSLTEALCRRDATCAAERHGRDWPTPAKCLAGARDRAREEIDDAGCTTGYDVDLVTACLVAIRGTACSVHLGSAADLPACDGRRMCLR